MKKSIILTGRQGSGKSHITKGFKIMVEEDDILEILFDTPIGFSVNLLRSLGKFKLLIVEDIPVKYIRKAYKSVEIYGFECNIIFQTQDKIVQSAFEDIAYIIDCNLI